MPAAGEEGERHITGQQLCEAIRKYALEQYGFMAKTVLNSWGVFSTGDFGEIVYNLIRIKHMKRSDRPPGGLRRRLRFLQRLHAGI